MKNKYALAVNVHKLCASIEAVNESTSKPKSSEPKSESTNEPVDELAAFQKLVLGPELKRQEQPEKVAEALTKYLVLWILAKSVQIVPWPHRRPSLPKIFLLECDLVPCKI